LGDASQFGEIVQRPFLDPFLPSRGRTRLGSPLALAAA